VTAEATDLAVPAERATRTPRKRIPIGTWGPPILVAIAFIGVWYLISALLGKKNFLLPPPHEVIIKGFLDPATANDIVTALGRSALVAVVGLAIAIVIGVVWAIAMSQARWIERSLFPYAVILQCIPILALVPLIGSIFGFEFPSRVIVTVMISLFPLVSNTLFGLQSADIGQRELFKLQSASHWTTLVKLQFPAALPSIFVGLRTAAGLSVIGAIVGDQFFQRGTPGLGVLIYVSNSRLNGPGTFAAIITASLLGVVVFLIFGLLGRLAVGKWYDFG